MASNNKMTNWVKVTFFFNIAVLNFKYQFSNFEQFGSDFFRVFAACTTNYLLPAMRFKLKCDTKGEK